MHGKQLRDRCVDLGDLLDDQDLGDLVKTGSAVLLGNIDAHEAQLSHFGDDLGTHVTCFIHLLRIRSDISLRKLFGKLNHCLLVFCHDNCHRILYLPSEEPNYILLRFTRAPDCRRICAGDIP